MKMGIAGSCEHLRPLCHWDPRPAPVLSPESLHLDIFGTHIKMHKQVVSIIVVFADAGCDWPCPCPFVPCGLSIGTDLVGRSQELSGLGACSYLVHSTIEMADLAVRRKDRIVQQIDNTALWTLSHCKSQRHETQVRS